MADETDVVEDGLHGVIGLAVGYVLDAQPATMIYEAKGLARGVHAEPIIEQGDFLLTENLLELLQEFQVARGSERRNDRSVMD